MMESTGNASSLFATEPQRRTERPGQTRKVRAAAVMPAFGRLMVRSRRDRNPYPTSPTARVRRRALAMLRDAQHRGLLRV